MDISLYVSYNELYMERNAVRKLIDDLNSFTDGKADLRLRALPEEEDYLAMVTGSFPEAAGNEFALSPAGLSVFLIGNEVWGTIRNAIPAAFRRRRRDPSSLVLAAFRSGPDNPSSPAAEELRRQMEKEDQPYLAWSDHTELWLAIVLLLESHPLNPLNGELQIRKERLYLGYHEILDLTRLPFIRNDEDFIRVRKDMEEENNRHNHWDWRYNSEEYDEAVYALYDNTRDTLIREAVERMRKTLRITSPKEGCL